MTINEKRRSTRYTIKNVLVNLRPSSSSEDKSGSVVDMSETGAFLNGCYSDDETAHVTFSPRRAAVVERNCTVARKDSQGRAWAAVQFDRPLEQLELRRLAGKHAEIAFPGSDKTYDFAKLDRAEVLQQRRDIRISEINVFAWSMGVLIGGSLSIWTLAIGGKLTIISTLPATGLLLGVFFLGVLFTVGSTRDMNLREGFAGALDLYLAKGQGPCGYTGWIHLKHCLAECDARRRVGLCQRGIPADSKAACADEGEAEAAALTSAKRIIPSAIGSSTSFVSFVYFLTFIVLTSLFCYSWSQTWMTIRSIPTAVTAGCFLCGIGLITVVWRYRVLVAGVLIGVASAICAGSMLPARIVIALVSFGMGVILGAMWWFLARQLRELRVGRFSPEAYSNTWVVVILHHTYPALPAAAQPSKVYTEPKRRRRWFNAIVNWLLGSLAHGRIVDNFRKQSGS